MSRNIRVNRGRKKQWPFMVVSLGAAVVFSAVIAGMWQVMLPPSQENFTPILPSTQPPISQNVQSVPNSPSAVSSSSAASSEGTKPTNGNGYDFSAPVPEGERVRSEYFDDAVFIGDSLTTGITLYDVMSNTTVYASTGINLDNVFTKEVIKLGERDVTIFEALKQKNPAKIYVMLGANGISQMEDSWILQQYEKLIKELKAQQPQALIYVQSVLPINEEIFHQKYNNKLTNPQIDEINIKLLKLAEENQVYFIDLNTMFKDATGGMPREATPDGLHIKSEQYIQWFDYLKTHTVQK